MKRIRGLSVLIGVMVLLPAVSTAEPAESVPTFTKDVAPILFENCVVCHREGEVAPMSLMTYAQARPWSRAIKEKVVAREMPPWHADPRYGEFRNARGLTKEQIDTIAAWVEAGAPKGDEADLPPAPEFKEGWVAGEPDYVIDQPVEYQIPAEGEIPNLAWYTPVPFEEDVLIEAIELRPGNTRVVHHSGAHMYKLPKETILRDGLPFGPDGQPLTEGALRSSGTDGVQPGGITPETNKLVSYVPGRGYESYGRGAAKRISAGEYIKFNQHYQPTGKPETERSKLGLYFYKGQPTHEVLNSLPGSSTYITEGGELRSRALPVIPPHAADWEIVSVNAVQNDMTIQGLSPHLHLRGKSMTYIVTYPDGTTETLLSVPKYDFNWQFYYDFMEPKSVPAGSKITVVTHFDNSVKNRYNPAPDKEVYWGEQSWDEMYSPQVRITIDKWDLRKMGKGATEEN